MSIYYHGQLVAGIGSNSLDGFNASSPLNLLDNWYLAAPVNQRGQSEYAATGYTLDRWIFDTATGAKITLQQGYTTLAAGTWLRQKIEAPVNFLSQKPVTASMLLHDGRLLTHTTKFTDYDHYTNAPWGTFETLYAEDEKEILFGFTDLHQDYDVTALKVEPGPFQTLAHKDGSEWVLNDPPPNYALELLKCQRYQYVANATGNPIAYFGQGTPDSTNTLVEIEVQIPNMRSYPDVSDLGSFILENESGDRLPVTQISIFRSSIAFSLLLAVKTSGTLTRGEMYRLLANNDDNVKIIFDSNL